VPEISRFLGIVIRMYFDDHLPPHFHASYGDQEAAVAIVDPYLFAGTLPPRVVGLVVEWATLHREELLADWMKARAMEPLQRIAPLT
jgi:hypothetical protein